MTRINGSSGNTRPQQTESSVHEKGLGSHFKPHLPHLPKKPSDLLKDPTPKPPGLSDLPKPPNSNILKAPKPPRAPGLPGYHRIPGNIVSNVQDRISSGFNSIRDRVNPKPTTDPREQTPSHQFNKTK